MADLNPRFGTEAGKTRPVLIVQIDLLNKIHPSCIICPISTNIIKDVTVLRVNIKKDLGGLKRDSAIMIEQIRAIDNKRLINKVGELPTLFQNRVSENLKIILDLE